MASWSKRAMAAVTVSMALPVGTAGAQTIDDAPRFAGRGLMLDVAQHFQPISVMKTMIDQMAAVTLNTLHIHLTNHQGWRVEITKYPKLTQVGGWRLPPRTGGPRPTEKVGGSYTQDDLKALVAYPAERGMTIVPEIDLPCLSTALVAAYPELGILGDAPAVSNNWGIEPYLFNPDPEGIHFVKEVLDELMAAVMSWRGEKGGIEAANAEHDFVLSPGGTLYLNQTQTLRSDEPPGRYGINSLESVSRYEPLPAGISGEPLWSLGHGLNYTRFGYDRIRASGDLAMGIIVTARIANTGGQAGDEVTQVYVVPPDSGERPNFTDPVLRHQLAGFVRTTLAAGRSSNVSLALDPRFLSVVLRDGTRRVLSGTYRIWIGGGQPDRSAGAWTEISLAGEARDLPK
ncbi:family 20 glycosylhydrolase [uncultured Sphingomonas sp.]|uniref:family 20 glycosylhydrolase n=1 Tax=uncultured Sphingomonas sp. TaxID=158754 RepID=UPI0025E89CAF|nr:family 20 glycosylhydrolase [uncultured Sphingomonas sp.]